MNYTDKLVKEARMVAVRGHMAQSYDGMFPYEKHLDDVIDILKRFDLGNNKYLIAGYLHDILEDGALSRNKIKGYFGEEIAEIVYCVTDELGRDRKEKKAKTLPKIAANPDAIIIKLADRIANIEHGGKIDMYAKEYFDFRFALYRNTPTVQPMWDHLEFLLKSKLDTVGNEN
jgi:(p)ppGpp synthase/HD superfamily hydrolase